MFREKEFVIKVTPVVPASVVAAAVGAVGSIDEVKRTTHSPDFASVWWFGKRYNFNGAIQKRVVAILWNAWNREMPDVPERELLKEAGSDSSTVRMLMKNNEAWDTLIQHSSLHDGPMGHVRLVEPVEE